MTRTIIQVFANTVNITSKCAEALYKAQEYEYELWIEPDEVAKDNELIFEPRYGAPLDWLASKDHLIAVLRKHRAKGDINFIELNDYTIVGIWGYRFDGKGGVKKMKGSIRWSTR